MSDGTVPFHYRIRREASGAFSQLTEGWHALVDGFRGWWNTSGLFRWLFSLGAIGLALLLALYVYLVWSLPDAESLTDYETPLPTVVRGIDGEIVHSYARERRVQLQYADFPRPLINAFLSAEDKTFFTHGGVDLSGTLNAVVDYARKYGSDERAVGGSTITQQVAKNLLLGDEYSVTRKLKEMVLARRIESVMSKPQILTLYLNEIPLGRRSFGVQAASRAYFDKDVADLDLHEAAFLAILPKAPEQYGRAKYHDKAVARRNFVLDQMAKNDFITPAEARAAEAQPLGLVTQRTTRSADAGYFLEEVRRELIDRFGETAEDGRNSVYAGGLWVRTSLDTQLQDAARDALRYGLLRYHGSRGWSGPIATIDFDDGDWQSQLASSNLGVNYKDWRVGVITERNGSRATIGFSDGKTAPLIGLPSKLKAGDVIAAAPSGSNYAVRTIPEVSGGMVVEDPQTGRVTAMQGGFDFRLGSFNRATQAMRQPGSTIKPFVYATGLDHGMTPSTQIANTSYCFYQGANLGEKCFSNSGGGAGGTHTLRWGLEQSQNLMTVRIAMDAGMKNVVDTFKRMNIGDYKPYPAFALGAGETTVLRMVNAYAALADRGRLHNPTLIDYVQDRRGKVIWRADDRPCEGCNMAEWDGKPMPRLGPTGKQVLDPRTAYQVTHMLEGVVIRGTGRRLSGMGLPLFGKTGTTTGPKDTWFMGGTQQRIAGVFIGFDNPRNMGGYAQGATVAAPVLKKFIEDTRKRWDDSPAVAPPGVRMVQIDRVSGKRVFGQTASDAVKAPVIWEAFKPDTEPPRTTRREQLAAERRRILALIREAERPVTERRSTQGEERRNDFVEQQGGIY
ncbi:transglycosylase domain-containing protein [Erythrobacter sp. LQ02-29]|uniref:penicillin-binding protein 1A n=1 Tax=Erythrobacter sp. LQ02-29 TaxID=2920384 RepID=UPI001F4D7F52|nr:transglycosylase domain-containing protein [Erythrobacter sp. LQ02-29]MCP9223079.1 transglycosylase domain-containing protein [Erythrobacter sp. LQ02-29]